MPPLPRLSGRDVVRIFAALGWSVARQRGSHIILVKEDHIATLSVPDHREVAQGTLRSLIRTAGLTVSEFLAARQVFGLSPAERLELVAGNRVIAGTCVGGVWDEGGI